MLIPRTLQQWEIGGWFPRNQPLSLGSSNFESYFEIKVSIMFNREKQLF